MMVLKLTKNLMKGRTLFDQFPGYHIKIFLGDFSAKVGREGGRTFLNQ
jgi:hypothetical protein